MPCIKVRKSSRIRWKKGNILRNLTVLAQKNDLHKERQRNMDKDGL
ncbi:MAG TPA: hypothetical protein VIY08_10335 [Candidatus Nitrosocosmicus sp.]